jgi:uncharacterized protein involved in outer membrane biogenesis
MMFLIAGLTAAPLLVDLEGYKKELISTIKSSTGLDPQVNGTVNVSFLPYPSIIVTNVSIPNLPDATTPQIIKIESVEVGSSFASIFSGKIDIRRVELVHPVLELEELPDGRQNWSLIKDALAKRDLSVGFRLPDKIIIKNGTVSYSAKGKKNTVDYITSNVAAGSTTGPFSMDGSFSNNNSVIKFKGDIGKLRDGAKATLDIASDSFSLSLDGKYSEEKEPKIEGSIEGSASNLGGFFGTFFENNSVFAKVKTNEKLTVDGDFLISDKILSFKKLKIASDSLTGKADIDALYGGKANIDSLQWDVDFNLDKLNVDKLITDPEIKEKPKEIDYYASTLNTTNISDFKFDMPRNFSALIRYKIKEITYNKQKINNVGFDADIFDGKAIINSITAELPGNSTVNFSGNVDNNGTRPLLHGRIDASGSSLRSIIIWLNENASFIPNNQLGEYMISSDLEMTPQKIDLSNGTISVDKTLISGDVSVRPSMAVPMIKAEIKIDRMDLDKYKITDKINEIAADFAQHANEKDLDHSWLQTFGLKLDISIDAKDLSYNSQKIQNGLITLVVSRGIFDLQRIFINSDVASLSGRVYFNTAEEQPKMSINIRSSGFDTAILLHEPKKKEEKFTWSKEPFNFLGIGRFDGDINLYFKSFVHKKLVLNNVVFESQMDKKVLTLKKATADIYNGKAALNGGIGMSEATPSLGISAVFSDVDLAPLIRNFTDNNSTTGNGYFSGTLKTFGKTPNVWITNLVMEGKVSGRNITVGNFDLENIIRQSQKLYSMIDMDVVIKSSMKSGTTSFSSIDGNITTAAGVIKATDFQMSSPLSRGVFAGNIGMLNFDINGIAKIAYAPEVGKNVTLGLSIKGGLDNFEKTLDTVQLEKYITDKGQKGVGVSAPVNPAPVAP